jgi:hypothetical protein
LGKGQFGQGSVKQSSAEKMLLALFLLALASEISDKPVDIALHANWPATSVAAEIR